MTDPNGKLYLVPTPIGNLEDVTLRALRIFKEVDLILAEDTRTTLKLLSHYDIKKTLKSYHIHNEHKILNGVIEELHEGKQIALVSDAGTPAISDPGFLLVRECLKEEIPVECLPGATAIIPALVKSGFPTDRFVFEGFLPHKKGRQTKIESFKDEERTIILYESPHRLLKALQQFCEILGEERRVSVSRELSKIYEETITGTAREVFEIFNEKGVKGEIVIILEGKN